MSEETLIINHSSYFYNLKTILKYKLMKIYTIEQIKKY